MGLKVLLCLSLLHSAVLLVGAQLYTLSNDPNDVHFYLYPTAGAPNFYQEIVYNNESTLAASLFQPMFKTVFIIHGFRTNWTSEMPQLLKNAYLASGLNWNFIIVDWGLLSTPLPPPLTSLLYGLVTENVPIVANRVAEFLTFLNANNAIGFNKIHLLGHSLGAHVSGLAGLYIQQQFNGQQLARVTGLDPAGPLFFPPISCRNLVANDATFVDVYHSNMGVLGDITQDGDVDFYPNGGVSQPDCALNDTGIPALDPSTVGTCSHRFSYKIYAASLTKTFTACQCDPLSNLLGLCYLVCPSPVRAGEYCPTTAACQYYFTTSNPP